MNNDTETLTLSDFLLARIAEDETAASAASPGGWRYGDVASVAGGSLYDESRMIGSMHYEQLNDHDGSIVRHLLSTEADANGAHIARHDPARVLAECAAKRAIVGRAIEDVAKADRQASDQIERSFNAGTAFSAHNTLLTLASIYADHPDYRSEWA